MPSLAVPFRWDVRRDPGAADGPGRGRRAQVYPGYREDLFDLAPRVLLAGQGADLAFLGRSPENLYDLLSGVLATTRWKQRIQLVQLSVRRSTPGQLRRTHPAALGHLWCYFETLGLTPAQLLARERPLALVDLVFSGRSLGNLLKLLCAWSHAERLPWPEVRDRLRWVCIVERGHPSYAAWEPDESRWSRRLPRERMRCLAVDWQMWRYMAEDQDKSTASHVPSRWAEPAAPAWGEELQQAARLGRSLYHQGVQSRQRFARELDALGGEARWVRRLVRELGTRRSRSKGNRR